MTTVQVPQQPQPLPLRDDIENLVFTHKSRFGKPTNIVEDVEDPRDWERVAFLGEGILLAAMSRVLYYAYPRHRTTWLNPYRTKLLSKDALASITDAYHFMDRLKCLEASRGDISVSLDNRAALAESFIGGLALQYGMDRAMKWAEEMLAWKHNLPVPISDEERLGLMPFGALAPPSPPPGPSFARPTPGVARRPGHPQIRPPQEVPRPAMEYQTPVQQPMYNPAMYQGAPAASTSFNADPFFSPPSYQTLQQHVPYMYTPSSQPTAAAVPQRPQPVDHTNFKYPSPPTQPSFYDSASYQ
ncbi:hypothetical protein FRC04_010454 [Tulasnella sp. 424]|nr:hypothetical protein FRC04_010454 [Tulasnella sp. 424]KAG8978614.1 hypothetical protein FRC05_009886 [Tulasnella sp. 425]